MHGQEAAGAPAALHFTMIAAEYKLVRATVSAG